MGTNVFLKENLLHTAQPTTAEKRATDLKIFNAQQNQEGIKSMFDHNATATTNVSPEKSRGKTTIEYRMSPGHESSAPKFED